MSATTKSLYETDFVEWAEETAKLLRERQFDRLDMENLIEEVESLARDQKTEVRIQLGRILSGLVVLRMQPDCDAPDWRSRITDARIEIRPRIEHSPSLLRILESVLEKEYQEAIDYAIEVFELGKPRPAELPRPCPWSLEELLRGDPE